MFFWWYGQSIKLINEAENTIINHNLYDFWQRTEIAHLRATTEAKIMKQNFLINFNSFYPCACFFSLPLDWIQIAFEILSILIRLY